MTKAADKILDERLLQTLNSYLADLENPDTPVIQPPVPDEIAARLDLTACVNGCSLDELYAHIRGYLEGCVKTGHRQYFNQLWAGHALPGFLGEVFAALSNTSMYTFEVAPIATLMEHALVQKMGGLAGFENPEGLIVPGGSLSNLQAMMLARHWAEPGIKHSGFDRPNRLVAFVSDQAHYSFDKAASVLGIGLRNLIKVSSDERGRMIPEDLEHQILRAERESKVPFFVGVTAGTTVLGAFDPIEAILPIARAHGAWLHVDGSLGGAALLSRKHRHLLRGCEAADSLVWNAHKAMGLPLTCSMLLSRKKGRLRDATAVKGAGYLFHDSEHAGYDLGPLSLQCGKKVDSLKLWLSWRYYGDKGYEERIDRFFALAEYAEHKVKTTPRLELLAPRSSFTVCFRCLPRGGRNVNDFNMRLREELARTGRSLVNYASLGNRTALRLVILNHEADESDLDRFFANLLETAESLPDS